MEEDIVNLYGCLLELSKWNAVSMAERKPEWESVKIVNYLKMDVDFQM